MTDLQVKMIVDTINQAGNFIGVAVIVSACMRAFFNR